LSIYDRSSLSPDHRQTLWTHGTLRCVLVTRSAPNRYALQVIRGERAVCSERCADPEEAASVAESFWRVFVERQRWQR